MKMPRSHHGEQRMARGHQTRLTGMAAIALIGLQAPVAHADILAFSSNVGFQLFGAAPAPVDLSSAAGAQNTLAFATPAPDLVEITFSAECSVWGTLFQYGTIQIVVDPAGAAPPVAIPPTAGFDDAFCSGNGVATYNDGWITPSMTVVTRVPKGVHTVGVTANAVAGATALRLDDLSITVDN
jgi:hypothetical protein